MPLISSFIHLPFFIPRRRARRRGMALRLLVVWIVLVVILPLYIVYKPPRVVISYFQSRFPTVLFHHPNPQQKIVALTIDDAPSRHTGEILAILKANEASATFFVIGGQVSGREDILVDIVRSGSELGNHAMHDEPSLSLSNDILKEEIAEVDELIAAAYITSGLDSPREKYFRPGSGFFSRRILNLVETSGHRLILGSVYPHDPFISYWWINAWHILSMTRKGSVIICHDRRSWTAPMLKYVLPKLRKKGYQIVSVSKFLEAAK